MALLAVLVALSHPAGSNPATSGFAFGRNGVKLTPFSVYIDPKGAVSTTGAAPRHRAVVPKARLAAVSRLAAQIGFTRISTNVEICSTASTDVPIRFVRIGSHAIRVHGSCDARFNRMWAMMNRAVAP
jgi:hypothetical protein